MFKDTIPKEYICPLTKEIMVDPLINRYGVSYERTAIIDHITNPSKQYCPKTKEPLTIRGLISNHKLRVQIMNYRRDVLGEDSTTANNCNDHEDGTIREVECIRAMTYALSPSKHPKKGLLTSRRGDVKNLFQRFSSGSCNSHKI